MTEQEFTDGILWCFAVGGGLWLIFLFVVGIGAAIAWVYDFLKTVRRCRPNVRRTP